MTVEDYVSTFPFSTLRSLGLDVWRLRSLEVWRSRGGLEVWSGGLEVWSGGLEVWSRGVSPPVITVSQRPDQDS